MYLFLLSFSILLAFFVLVGATWDPVSGKSNPKNLDEAHENEPRD